MCFPPTVPSIKFTTKHTSQLISLAWMKRRRDSVGAGSACTHGGTTLSNEPRGLHATSVRCRLSPVPSHPGRSLAPGGRQRDPAFLHGERREGRSRVRVATQAARSAPRRCGDCGALRQLRAQSARDTALDPGPAASGAASARAGVIARPRLRPLTPLRARQSVSVRAAQRCRRAASRAGAVRRRRSRRRGQPGDGGGGAGLDGVGVRLRRAGRRRAKGRR